MRHYICNHKIIFLFQMNKFPLVSVITPSFNQGEFLEETILSVLNQKYSNIEYFIIDGGSNDNSVEIIKKYESKLKFWVSEKDKGQSDAINKGWKMANGEIICWINSDDFFDNDEVISEVVNTFQNSPDAGIVFGNCQVVDEYSKNIRLFHAKDFILDNLLYDNFGEYIMQPASFFNRKAVFDVGLLDLNYHYSMDFEFVARLISKYSAIKTNKTLARYRIHSKAKSIEFGKKQMAESLKIRYKYNKIAYLIHFYRNIKLEILYMLPVSIRKKIKPRLG